MGVDSPSAERADRSAAIQEGDVLWTPSPEALRAAALTRYSEWLAKTRGVVARDYGALWRWSVGEPEAFWESLWQYFDVRHDGAYQKVLNGRSMPGARWFEGTRVNYAEHLLRHEEKAQPGQVAIYYRAEHRPMATVTWPELGRRVRRLASRLRALGVVPGDRVVAYMPNAPETATALLATTAIGAVWSAAAPEFGVQTVLDRFAQIEPRVLFAVDGYRFAGKDYDRIAEVRRIVAGLPSVEFVVWLPYLNPEAELPGVPALIPWRELVDDLPAPASEFSYERVPWDHPLWVLFSSGTTGLPKAIVHGHVGMLLEHLKSLHLHTGLRPESALFFYTTTGWMVWNTLVAALVTGSSIVLHDGHPATPQPDALWRIVADCGATVFGASPTYVRLMEQSGVRPRDGFDLSRLEAVVLTGSPSTPETFAWFYREVKQDLRVYSSSGGTELCTGIVGGVPTLPIRAGEIQGRLLGMDAHVWSDDGRELVDETGELVITTPTPSMPLRFWNDPSGQRYRESYFDVFPGVWRHGDFMRIDPRGACFIYGRSDATLNRYGVRIGTAEIYRALERVPGVADSLVVCLELPHARFLMPLFVKLAPGTTLDERLRERISDQLRRDCSPRHVPDRIVAVTDIPYTLTGKKMEVPVRRLLAGAPLERVASRDTMQNPQALEPYVALARAGFAAG
jgi:acetoacetyl-CoA synthetase